MTLKELNKIEIQINKDLENLIKIDKEIFMKSIKKILNKEPLDTSSLEFNKNLVIYNEMLMHTLRGKKEGIKETKKHIDEELKIFIKNYKNGNLKLCHFEDLIDKLTNEVQ